LSGVKDRREGAVNSAGAPVVPEVAAAIAITVGTGATGARSTAGLMGGRTIFGITISHWAAELAVRDSTAAGASIVGADTVDTGVIAGGSSFGIGRSGTTGSTRVGGLFR
jgi:hypothetical protein